MKKGLCKIANSAWQVASVNSHKQALTRLLTSNPKSVMIPKTAVKTVNKGFKRC